MKQMLRYLCLLLCLLLTVTVMLACTDLETPSDTPDGDELPPEEPVNMVDVVAGGESYFRIVRNDFYTLKDVSTQAVVSLRSVMLAATDVAMDITTDYDKPTADVAEILVGDTNRESSKALPEDLAENEFIIRYDGKDIIINGKTQLATKMAVNYFLTTYLGYDPETESCSKTECSIPENLDYRGTFEMPMRVYLLQNIRAVSGGGNEDLNDAVRLYT
jgi:hypothetical protein